jgi:hypothetical protein
MADRVRKPVDVRNEFAASQAALQKQAERLAEQLAEATTARNRAVARAAQDDTKANQTARDAATGAVVRLEAELAATRSALEQSRQDEVQHTEETRIVAEAARLNRCVGALREAARLAGIADQAASAFVESYLAFSQAVSQLQRELPAALREDVFGGGMLLGGAAMQATATYMLSKCGVVPRPTFEPNPNRQTLEALVNYFGIPVIEAANRVNPDDVITADLWEN